jgi:hypothetical protein
LHPSLQLPRQQAKEPPKISVEDPDDPKVQGALEQRRRVNRFFARFRNPDGSSRGGFTRYTTLTKFKERMANDLKYLLRERLLHELKSAGNAAPAVAAAPAWLGSPYPGLRPFTDKEAPIFFGRGREVDAPRLSPHRLQPGVLPFASGTACRSPDR